MTLADTTRAALTGHNTAGRLFPCDATSSVLAVGPTGTAAEASRIATAVRTAGLAAHLINHGQEVLVLAPDFHKVR